VSPFGIVDVSPDHHQVSHLTSSVTFTCQSQAGPNLTYNWLFNDNMITGSNVEVNGTKLVVNNVTHLLGGTYTCVVTNQAGMGTSSGDLFGKYCSYIAHLLFKVISSIMCCIILSVVDPLITTHPTSQLSSFGDVVNFTCIAVSFPPPSYNWSIPITYRSFTTNIVSLIVEYDYFGNYTCISSSTGPKAVSDAAMLTGMYFGCVHLHFSFLCFFPAIVLHFF